MTNPSPPRLRERLHYDATRGALHDGPPRYMLLRPDHLMGALRTPDPAARETMFEALAQSTLRFGGDSLRAYAAEAPGDAQALIDATVGAAADLGQSRGVRWHLRAGGQPRVFGRLAVDALIIRALRRSATDTPLADAVLSVARWLKSLPHC